MTEQILTESKSEKTNNPFWPDTIFGKISVGLLVAYFILDRALVNVVQVPFLRWIMLIGVLVLSYLAKFRSKDKSIAVTITFVLVILGVVFWVSFLLGELVFPHS